MTPGEAQAVFERRQRRRQHRQLNHTAATVTATVTTAEPHFSLSAEHSATGILGGEIDLNSASIHNNVDVRTNNVDSSDDTETKTCYSLDSLSSTDLKINAPSFKPKVRVPTDS